MNELQEFRPLAETCNKLLFYQLIKEKQTAETKFGGEHGGELFTLMPNILPYKAKDNNDLPTA